MFNSEELTIFIAMADKKNSSEIASVIQTKSLHKVVGYSSDLKSAYDEIESLNPNMIIIDDPFLTVLKKINEKTITPCILFTANFNAETIDKANRLGVFSFLNSPIAADKHITGAIDVACKRFEFFKEMESKTESLKIALEERKYIEKAKGILMDSFSIKEEDAMKYLQKRSRDQNKKMIQIANDIILAAQALKL